MVYARGRCQLMTLLRQRDEVSLLVDEYLRLHVGERFYIKTTSVQADAELTTMAMNTVFEAYDTSNDNQMWYVMPKAMTTSN